MGSLIEWGQISVKQASNNLRSPNYTPWRPWPSDRHFQRLTQTSYREEKLSIPQIEPSFRLEPPNFIPDPHTSPQLQLCLKIFV
jgi:hypothetical protein